jgi:putative colanic acid biosynthesis UDP-glucose lipid carrier transferase
MKNSTAQTAIENSVLKKVDHLEVLDVVYPRITVPVISDRSLPLQKPANLFFKRSFDLLFSSLLIVLLLSWLLPLIGMLIRLNSRGPVFFLQKRHKKNGRLFTCIKFRTMIVNEQADTMAASDNDSRITSLGKFLRQRHLDELPQLFNVFAGDMSLIGPRPYMISDSEKYEEYVEHYESRYSVKPGITGPAQLLGYGGDISDAAKIRNRAAMDHYYVNHWSPGMDMVILYRTVKKGLGW